MDRPRRSSSTSTASRRSAVTMDDVARGKKQPPYNGDSNGTNTINPTVPGSFTGHPVAVQKMATYDEEKAAARSSISDDKAGVSNEGSPNTPFFSCCSCVNFSLCF
ncbi:uncharacterized protein LOC120286486 [Eucalyptus grandis]|uniref:uncharacterized protein LOC120286486 n=1 Tax=Eucalyptus grandis TaxID=71139 RepID=UPI00192EA9AB|nr:uncharacterized protein LOC120286486 [Eucalyptus grandis]